MHNLDDLATHAALCGMDPLAYAEDVMRNQRYGVHRWASSLRSWATIASYWAERWEHPAYRAVDFIAAMSELPNQNTTNRAAVLLNTFLGIPTEDIADVCRRHLRRGPGIPDGRSLDCDEEVWAIAQRAFTTAKRSRTEIIREEHFFAALLHQPLPIVKSLRRIGVTAERYDAMMQDPKVRDFRRWYTKLWR